MRETILKLSPEKVQGLQETCPVLTIDREWDLAYDGQVPLGAVVLIKGIAHLTRHNRLRELLEEGSVYGLRQLRDGVPVKFGCRLGEGARIIILHKNELTKINL